MGSSPSRIARRHMSKTAGGCGFNVYGKGRDPRKVFSDLVEAAGFESGHGGYSGTIAEKGTFKLRKRTPMTRSQARDFIEVDMMKNEKWGPAFAVPIASEKVVGQKEYVVKVKARNRNDALKLGKEAIAAKGRSRRGAVVEVEVRHGDVNMVKPGGVPEMSVIPLSGTTFVSSLGYKTIISKTKREALSTAKMVLAQSDVPVGKGIKIQKVQDLLVLKKTGEASKLPVWEVKGTRKQVLMGNVEGYMFYGIASC